MTESIESVIPQLLEFRSLREWEQFHQPKELATAISIEVSELLELFLWREKETAEEVKQDARRIGQVCDEVADILIYLLYLSHDLDIDLTTAMMRKLEKNRRKYPEDECRGIYRKP
jgi:NTP pyrophosphatase (non-canonical NTP hydrolase)